MTAIVTGKPVKCMPEIIPVEELSNFHKYCLSKSVFVNYTFVKLFGLSKCSHYQYQAKQYT
ncbi:hypothetical protein MTHERMMSTA1_24130 [Methanosarcina thermophila MST-A1]|uniref:Uncharacterized protein n=1 Tax=Methanosarcina thermophila TaxID=2210 RepID=A0A3G9CW43_METTE|nr:conserved hypothetical protein [Methanosarcina thermophila]GLI15287.1 hypothetical protein MTHERMMSTA1_24130 [Methanosarcina thermophila MST-A1]